VVIGRSCFSHPPRSSVAPSDFLLRVLLKGSLSFFGVGDALLRFRFLNAWFFASSNQDFLGNKTRRHCGIFSCFVRSLSLTVPFSWRAPWNPPTLFPCCLFGSTSTRELSACSPFRMSFFSIRYLVILPALFFPMTSNYVLRLLLLPLVRLSPVLRLSRYVTFPSLPSGRRVAYCFSGPAPNWLTLPLLVCDPCPIFCSARSCLWTFDLDKG